MGASQRAGDYMIPVETVKQTLNDLERWYWCHGIERINRTDYPLRPDWAAEIYTIQRTATQILERQHYPRPALAIYGESQVGKSTILMTELDDTRAIADTSGENTVLSAIQWDDRPVTWGDWRSWHDSADYIVTKTEPLNPYSAGTDATAVPTRFTLTTNVTEPQIPYQIRMQSVDSLIAALYAGLSDHGQIDAPNGKPRGIKKIEITPGEPDADLQRALMLLEAVRQMVAEKELLINEAGRRVHELEPFSINELFPCTYNQARRWVGEYLFGKSHSLFDNILSEHLRLIELLEFLNQYNTVLCSPLVARRILKFDHSGEETLSEMMFYERSNENGRRELAMAMEHEYDPSERWQVMDRDRLPITRVVAFQLVVRELVVPVREDVLGRINAPFADVLRHADIIDFPGISIMPDRHRGQSIDNDERRAFVLKFGKTACVLRDFVASELIDGILFVCTAEGKIRDSTSDLFTRVIERWVGKTTSQAISLSEVEQNTPTQERPVWWVATRWNAVEAAKATTTISAGIGSIQQGLQHCRFRLYATHYPIWNEMIASPEEEQRIRSLMRGRLRKHIRDDGAQKSFDNIKLTILKPGEALESTRCIWDDVSHVYKDFVTHVDLTERRIANLRDDIRRLLQRNEAYPGGEQVTQNNQRRVNLRKLEYCLLHTQIKRQLVLSVSPLPRHLLAQLAGSVEAGDYASGLFKAMMRSLRDQWREQARDEFAQYLSASEVGELTKALEDSVWMATSANDSMRTEFYDLFPRGRAVDSNRYHRLDGLGQLMAMRLGDWLTGLAEEPHGLRDEDIPHIIERLVTQDATYGTRDPLPGDTQLSAISGLSQFWDSIDLVNGVEEGDTQL